jgi:hypothetical protein
MRTITVVAKEVCQPACDAVAIELDVADGATVKDAKRLLSIAKPAWVTEKQLWGAGGATLADGDALAGRDDFLAWVSCVCQRKPLANLFLPPGHAAAPAAGAAPDDHALWDDVID